MACIEITPDDFDAMHHALGRPAAGFGSTYRNHYCIGADTDDARRMAALPVWKEARRINGGKDIIFCVSDDGKSALRDWLELRS